MESSPDKRSSTRTALHQVVRFERMVVVAIPAGTAASQGLGRDISAQGLSFLTDCPLRQGDVLRLHIPLELDRPSVPVLSEVRWARPEHEGFRVGLQFLA